LLSTHELSYPDLSKPDATVLNVKQLTSTEGASTRRSLMEKKKASWNEGLADDRFVTTKKATVDATGQYAMEHYSYTPGPSTRCGAFLRSAGASYQRTGLRADD
jgi:hypothetical protein